MDLIIWRHAEAEDGADDLSRRLTAKGIHQAASMADWLRPRLPDDAVVIASQAVRSQQTARALSDGFAIHAEINPDADYGAVLKTAGWPDAGGAVVLVGHQPTLGRALALLLTGEPRHWTVKKGAVWWLSCRVRDARPQTVLRAMMTPDMLR